MNLTLGYGKGKMNVDVPDGNVLAVLEPNNVEIRLTGSDEVKRALENPIGSALKRHRLCRGENLHRYQ